jgi:hypothetical protein
MLGFERLPQRDKQELAELADTKFAHTVYSFNDIVKSTESRALEVVRRAGGTVSESQVTIPVQSPEPPALELWDFGIPVRAVRADDPAWQWQGEWRDVEDRHNLPAKECQAAGCEGTLKFNGTAIALVSNLSQNGGRADVYIDDVKNDLIADAYIIPNTIDDDLWRIYNLPPGDHVLRLVTRDDADSRSSGRRIMINRALIYQSEK